MAAREAAGDICVEFACRGGHASEMRRGNKLLTRNLEPANCWLTQQIRRFRDVRQSAIFSGCCSAAAALLLGRFRCSICEMARSIRVAVGIGALFLAGWNCVACGSSSDSHPGPLLGAAGATATGRAGSGGGNGLDLGTGNNTGIG